MVQNKKKTIFDVYVALANLEFHVYAASVYVCRQRHGLLKKRNNLQQNLSSKRLSILQDFDGS